jgi:small subunit ribosomal protein S1
MNEQVEAAGEQPNENAAPRAKSQRETMAELLDRFENSELAEGNVVAGTVMEIHDTGVLVDIGHKSEGTVPLDEFPERESLKVGDTVDVLLERYDDEEDVPILSVQKAIQKKNWERVTSINDEGGTVTGTVKRRVKGGLIVDIGVDAFLPGSQVDLSPVKNLDDFVGRTFEYKIIKINHDRKNIVLSRRELLEEERRAKRRELLDEIQEGQTRTGIVKNITDFGAFIDLDGLDGLLHITDMSWGRVNHPSEVVTVGDLIQVLVLDVNRDKERVSLGLKQLKPNPWENIERRYPIGARVHGKVVNLAPYGAFVELEPGVEGLVHVSELSWTKRVAKPSDVLSVGDEVEAVVLSIDKGEQRISLGIRQTEENPWEAAARKYPPGTKIQGVVRNLTNYGAFVGIEEGLDGMIHVSDMSWTRKINHPSEAVKKGDEVEAVVLEIDVDNQRISLGLKQLQGDPWEDIEARYHLGDLVTGKVTKLTSFGAFVELEEGIDGLVHISQVSDERINKVKDVLSIGQEVTARVIRIDPKERRIGLSIRAALHPEDEAAYADIQKMVADPGGEMVTLSEAFDAAIAMRDDDEEGAAQTEESPVEEPVPEMPREPEAAETPVAEAAATEEPAPVADAKETPSPESGPAEEQQEEVASEPSAETTDEEEKKEQG